MAQKFSPELYLSDKAIASRCQSDHPLPKYPDHLLDVLDALAAICVRHKGDVSLTVDPNYTTLHVSTNGTVPATLITHLHKIQGQLKKLNSVAASGPLTLADIIDFAVPLSFSWEHLFGSILRGVQGPLSASLTCLVSRINKPS